MTKEERIKFNKGEFTEKDLNEMITRNERLLKELNKNKKLLDKYRTEWFWLFKPKFRKLLKKQREVIKQCDFANY
jgi:hypothetical protein